jgi:hypothetical protein
MKTKHILAAVFASTLSVGAFASNFSYNYVDVSAGELQINDNTDGKFQTGTASISINDNFYVTASADHYTFDVAPFSLSQNTQKLGFGAHASIADSTDVYAIASVLNTKSKISYFSFNDSTTEIGYALNVGIRHAIDDVFEVDASLSNVHQFDDFNTIYTLTGLAHITSNLDILITAQKPEDAEVYSAGIRYNF